MANYQQLEGMTNIFIEQNIWDNQELISFEKDMGVALMYQEDKNRTKYYVLHINHKDLENYGYVVVEKDLTDVFTVKSAKGRRKKILKIIKMEETV